MRRFFRKENATQAVWLSNVKKWQKFEVIDRDVGVLSTELPDVLTDLDLAIRNGAGGVVEIDQQSYEELRAQKKNQREIDSQRRWREEFSPNKTAGSLRDSTSQVLERGQSDEGATGAVASGSPRPPRFSPPTQTFRPTARE